MGSEVCPAIITRRNQTLSKWESEILLMHQCHVFANMLLYWNSPARVDSFCLFPANITHIRACPVYH